MSTRERIVREVMINVVFCSKKAALDQLLDGLCSLRFHELMVAFLESFERVFCASAAESLQVNSSLLLSMVNADCTNEEEALTYQHLKTYLFSLNQDGTAH